MDYNTIAETWIIDTLMNLENRLKTHDSISVGVSGGSDSNIIVHMICTNFRQYLPKIHFVFQNTGLEYKATIKHLEYIENRYNIKIDRIRGLPVPYVVNKYGIPVLSKRFSTLIEYAEKDSYWALVKMGRLPQDGKNYLISKSQQNLAAYLVDNKIKVSSKCCDLSKKKPHKAYNKLIKADLDITGERQCEGGMRAVAHRNGCFESGKKGRIDKYMPLWYWNDETKQYYKEKENIRYSDCYEIWGMKRTGCVGCPFNSRIGEDLKAIKKYEPNLYKACMNVFGESYRLMDTYNVHRNKILGE